MEHEIISNVSSIYGNCRIEAKNQSRHPKDAATVALCLRVAKALAEEFPQHPWRVVGQPDNSAVAIMNDNLSTKMGFLLHNIRLDDNPTDFRLKVMRAAGEVLERYEISRTARGERLRAEYDEVAHLARFR